MLMLALVVVVFLQLDSDGFLEDVFHVGGGVCQMVHCWMVFAAAFGCFLDAFDCFRMTPPSVFAYYDIMRKNVDLKNKRRTMYISI